MKAVNLKVQGQCVKIKARNGGHAVTYKVCLLGPKPETNLYIRRGGRRGGIRGSGKDPGGMLVCTGARLSNAPNPLAKCFRERAVYIYPGGKANMRRWPGTSASRVEVVNGLSGYRRRRKRRK